MTNEQLEQRLNDMQFQLDDVKNTRDPLRANQRIDLLEQKIEAFGVRIEELGQKLNAFGKDDKFIELFTDEEFKLLYKNSGLGAKDIANLMKANENFKELDSTPQSINQIINGKRGSLELRSYLGKQFRFAITKRKDI